MPVDAATRQKIREKHFPGGTSEPRLSRCIRDGEPWPCDVARLLDVAVTAAHFTGTWDDLLRGSDGRYLLCEEVTAAAELWRALGASSTAETLTAAHAEHALPDDIHCQRDKATAHA